jgi:putative ABC transport system permease protein
VILANLVAWPVAYVAMRTWLSGFDQRVALTPVYFLAATALALVVAAATVIAQALRIAAAEPARALRHD